jgi:hypothetical protein
MDVFEPHLRHRGFFLHSDTGEPDTGEHENPEGFVVRVRTRRSARPAKTRLIGPRTLAGTRNSGGRQPRSEAIVNDGRMGIRSASVTGSRQRAHLPR